MPAGSFGEKPIKDRDKIFATMQERLKLTDAQAEKIRPILHEPLVEPSDSQGG